MAIVEFEKALDLLKNGEVVGIPTETVYGLAARIDNGAALKKIFTTKKRPFFDPLIVHLSQGMDPRDYTLKWPPLYIELAKQFWPGPLTLIAPKNKKISDLITSGLPDVGLRSPNHALTNKLIDELGVPVAAPSANLFGKTSPTKPNDVIEEFAGSVAVLEGGDTTIGLESTVVSLDESEKRLFVLRPGFITRLDLESVCQTFGVSVESGHSKAAPGQLKVHYQPKAPVVLEFTKNLELTHEQKNKMEQKISSSIPLEWRTLKLSDSPVIAARHLYSLLRENSQGQNPAIWIPLDPNTKNDPHWEMIIDRLQRAASLILS